MGDWNTIIRGQTGTHADILIKTATGIAGLSAGFALSKVPYSTAHLTITGLASSAILGADIWDPSGESEAHITLIAPFLRGVQVMIGYTIYQRFGKAYAALALLEPIAHTALSLMMDNNRLPMLLHVWGKKTPEPKEKRGAHRPAPRPTKAYGKLLVGALLATVIAHHSSQAAWVMGVGTPALFLWDFAKNDEQLCHHGGGTALLRGVQLGVTGYAALNGLWPLAILTNIDAFALTALTSELALVYGLS